MASGRAVPQSRLHRHQPADGARLGGEVLQPARHRRAAHQGRQICLSLDAAVMPEVPAQRGAAATARAGLQPGNLPALHRTARGHGGLVVDQPATQADQDRRPRRPPRPRHYLPVGRGRRHRPDGAGRPCRHPPSSNASVMRMTTIHAQAERKRQDRSVCRAEKRLCRARMLRVRGLIHPTSAVCATTDTARGEKRLPSEQNQAILKSSGRPLGECRFRAFSSEVDTGSREENATKQRIRSFHCFRETVK